MDYFIRFLVLDLIRIRKGEDFNALLTRMASRKPNDLTEIAMAHIWIEASDKYKPSPTDKG